MNEPVLFIYRKEGGRQSEQSKKFEIRIHVAGGTESQRGKEQTGIGGGNIRIVEKNAEEVNILKKMTRHIAETFVEEITIYDSEKIEIRFVFDDLLIGMADRIKKKTEDIA